MRADAESSCTESRTDSWSQDGARNPWSAPITELWTPTRARTNHSDIPAVCALRVLRAAPLGHRRGRTLRGAGATCRALTNHSDKSGVRLSHGSRHHPQRRAPIAVRTRSPGSAIRCGILRVVLWQSLTDVRDRLVVGGRSDGSLGGASWLFARLGSCDRRSGRLR